MSITKKELKKMFLAAASLLKENCEEFSKIDSQFGDGDHGITIGKIAKLMEEKIEAWSDNESIKDFIDDLGTGIMGVNGGSAGPLWGTLISGLVVDLDDEEELTIDDFKKMLKSSLSEMQDITTAKVGEKTMMDTLIPAVETAENSKATNFKEFFEEIAKAAEQGAEDTKKYISKFGRAKSYKEKTLGYKDAGATSLACLFRGLANGIK